MGDKIESLDLREVAKARTSGNALGSAGVIEVGGFLYSDEKVAELMGSKKYETYAQMLNDHSIIAAGVRLFLNLISKSAWQVVPAEMNNENEQGEADRIAEAVESAMFDHTTPWHRIVRRTAMFKFMGFCIQEWTAKKNDDGSIAMADVESRPQRTIHRWELDDSGDVLGVYQLDKNQNEVYLPRDRLIYAVDDSLNEHPEGVGLLRHAVRAATRLKAFEQLEEIGFENDLRGIPIAYAPLKDLDAAVASGEKTEADKNTFLAPIKKFVSNHIKSRKTGMMMDSETYRTTNEAQSPSSQRKWSLELLRGESTAFDPIAKAITRLNQEIARVLGIEHILLGSDGTGSLALSKSKVGTFYLTVTSTQAELVEIFENDWLAPLADLNGWHKDFMPSLACEEVRDVDIEQVTQALAHMANSGAILAPDDPAINEVRHMLGLSEQTDPIDDLDLDLGSGDKNPRTGDPVKDDDLPEDGAVKKLLRKSAHWIFSRDRNKGI